MTQRIIFPLLLVLGLIAWGCGTTQPVVATIGKDNITLKEFEQSYSKNNGGPDSAARSTLKQREDFLDLLVKFRLKVAEAKDRKIDQEPSIQTEIRGYELSVAETYIVEKELIDANVRKMYDRKKEELRASHLLIRADRSASPEDTLKAYQKTMDILRKVPSENFDSLVVRYSEEPNASVSKGDLGYFSAGRMVPEFEDAAFSLSPGEVSSLPVRTQFGYHIIKMRERHPNSGPLRISFIIMYYNRGGDSTAIRDTAWAVYRRLRNGEDFATLARQYSHDQNTAMRGGDVGYYEKDRLPPQIAEILTHTPKDSVSEPLFLQNGLYIFKVTDLKGIPPFDQEQASLRQQYRQMRYERDYETYLHTLEETYHLTFDAAARSALEHAFPDSTTTPADSAWDSVIDPSLRSSVLLRFDGGSATVGEMLRLIGAKPEFQTLALTPTNLERMIHQISRQMVLLHHAESGSAYSQEFTDLMDEYRNGILLYQIEQEEVWNKVQVNDSVLRAFYEPRMDSYRLPPRVNVAEIYVTRDSLMQVARKRVDAGEDFLDVAEDMTMRAGYRDKRGVWGYQPYPANDLTKRAQDMAVGEVSPPFQNGAGWSMIKVLEKDSARAKTFEEASLEVTSEYQEYAAKKREREWLDALRKKFGVVENKDILSGAFMRKDSASR